MAKHWTCQPFLQMIIMKKNLAKNSPNCSTNPITLTPIWKWRVENGTTPLYALQSYKKECKLLFAHKRLQIGQKKDICSCYGNSHRQIEHKPITIAKHSGHLSEKTIISLVPLVVPLFLSFDLEQYNEFDHWIPRYIKLLLINTSLTGLLLAWVQWVPLHTQFLRKSC